MRAANMIRPLWPAGARRLLAGWVVLAIGMTGAVVVPPIARAAATVAEMAPPVPAAADEPSARVRALQTGQRVEVVSAKTETVRVFATPSGTLTAEISAVPQRVRRPDNTWAPVDTRLRFAGGAVRPVATVSAVSFSAGGEAPLA